MLSKNRAHTKIILLHAPHGCQNAIQRQGKDLATRDAASGLVSLSACSVAKGSWYSTLHVVDLAIDNHRHHYLGATDSPVSLIDLLPSAAS